MKTVPRGTDDKKRQMQFIALSGDAAAFACTVLEKANHAKTKKKPTNEFFTPFIRSMTDDGCLPTSRRQQRQFDFLLRL